MRKITLLNFSEAMKNFLSTELEQLDSPNKKYLVRMAWVTSPDDVLHIEKTQHIFKTTRNDRTYLCMRTIDPEAGVRYSDSSWNTHSEDVLAEDWLDLSEWKVIGGRE